MTTDSADTVNQAIAEVRAAIQNAGPVPSHHRVVMARHREEWPTLWRALDHLMDATGGKPVHL